MTDYITVRVTVVAYERALRALRFEIALATRYPSHQYNGDQINGLRRSLDHLEAAQRIIAGRRRRSDSVA